MLMQQQKLERKDLSEIMGMNYSLLSAYIGENPTKAIGDKVALRIAEALNVDIKYIDTDHDLIKQQKINESDAIAVPFYSDIYDACRTGVFNDTQDYVITTLMLSASKLKDLQIVPTNVRSFLFAGNSMYPFIPGNSEVFYDRSRKSIKDEGYFAISHGGVLKVRKIFQVPYGGIKLVSTNANKDEYPDEVLTEDQIHDKAFIILGQIFYINHSIPL
jgi:phage repressor protein C with HTH and peptisase S24 domain